MRHDLLVSLLAKVMEDGPSGGKWSARPGAEHCGVERVFGEELSEGVFDYLFHLRTGVVNLGQDTAVAPGEVVLFELGKGLIDLAWGETLFGEDHFLRSLSLLYFV